MNPIRLSSQSGLKYCQHRGSAALTGNSEEFRSVEGINQSLGELYKLLAQDRISPRRAAVLAYISNLLLRTVTAMENLQEEEPMRLNFDGMTSPISEVEQARPEFAS